MFSGFLEDIFLRVSFWQGEAAERADKEPSQTFLTMPTVSSFVKLS